MSQLLTVEEVADRLRLSVGHVYRLVERGDIERIKIGQAVRIDEATLTAFLRARTHTARVTRRVA